jgi:hypothetical protein
MERDLIFGIFTAGHHKNMKAFYLLGRSKSGITVFSSVIVEKRMKDGSIMRFLA